MTLAAYLAQLETRAADAERIGAQAPVAALYRAVAHDLAPFANGHGGLSGPPPSAPEVLLTPTDVARRLGVSRRFVYQHRGELGGRALSRRALRFPEAALARYLARRP